MIKLGECYVNDKNDFECRLYSDKASKESNKKKTVKKQVNKFTKNIFEYLNKSACKK